MDDEDFFQQDRRQHKIKHKQHELQKQQMEEEEIKHIKEEATKKDKKSQAKEGKKEDDDAQSQKPSMAPSKDSSIETGKPKARSNKKKIKEVTKPAQLVESVIGKPYFLVPDTTPQDISKADQESLENKVRRWEIFISEIKLENLQKDDLSVFLNFRIGQVGKNKNRFEEVSSDEVFFKSEIAKNVKRSEVKPVRVVFNCEMHLSYQMLKERYFLIEVWQYRPFLLNMFLGMIRVPLIDIVSGPMARQNNIKKATGEKRQFARIYYKILFQEVWDYKLTFEAWKASNIMGEGGIEITPKLELTLMTEDEPTVKSEVQKKSKNPNFKNLKGFMHFRGTMESLTEQMIMIKIYKDAYFEFCRKLVSLRGIQDTNYLKSQFRLKLKKPPMSHKMVIARKRAEGKQDLMMEEDDEDEDEDMLQDKSIYCVVEGRINLNKTPRYMQIGELNRYVPEQYYLVIIINRLEKVLSPDDRGVINTFLTVSWRDQQKVTQVMKDNSNPTYNEELFFRMPLLKPELTLEDIINSKTIEQLQNDAIREELRNRPDINIQLWLDGADVMTDESLGYCRVFLSEIQKASKQPKMIVTDDNRRRTFETRIQTFKKKFTSGLFNLSPITVHFQACFIPDLPDEIDLGDFTTIQPDFYPMEISEQMERMDDWRRKNPAFKKWEKGIKFNFEGYGGIEKNAYSLFYNSIFVKDQFDNLHLVCKYLEKFYVRYQSQEGTRELFASPFDISMKTLHELVHFVRNIPFIGDSFSKKEVWMSPDFLLKIRKGFPHDHAVLAACLFLGCELEDHQAEEAKWQNYVSLEHRTFVCLGTLKLNTNQHAWIMTFSYTFDEVVFWDIQDNKRYVLKGRVHPKEIKKLRKHLYPEFKATKTQKSAFAGFDTKKKVSKKQLRREARIKRQKEEQQRLQKERVAQEKLEKKRKEDEDQQFKKSREFAKFQSDNMDVVDNQPVEVDAITLTHTKMKNERQLGLVKLEQQQTLPKQSQPKPAEAPPVAQKAVFQNPFAGGKKEPKKGVLDQRQDEQEAKRMMNKDAKFTQEEIFYTPDGSKLPADKFELPYATLEIVFNQKNIWGNLGNQNPQQITYHLHREDCWQPFLTFEKVYKEDEEDDDEDDADESEEDDDAETPIITVQWMEKMGVFYGAQILSEPIRKDKVKKIIKDIYFEVQGGIVKARAKAGYSTKWKHELDGFNNKMLELLNIIEYKDTNRTMQIIRRTFDKDPDNPENKLGILVEKEEACRDYDYIMREWEREVKKMIPLNCKYEALPMKFTFTQSEKMRTIIVENMSSFFLVDHKKIVFNLIGRIFNYPNKVCCVRLLLGYTYSQISEAADLQQSDQGSDEDEDQPAQTMHEQPILEKLDEEDENPEKPLIK